MWLKPQRAVECAPQIKVIHAAFGFRKTIMDISGIDNRNISLFHENAITARNYPALPVFTIDDLYTVVPVKIRIVWMTGREYPASKNKRESRVKIIV